MRLLRVWAVRFRGLLRVTMGGKPTILDVGERVSFKRGHYDGAVNIPVEELTVRAPIELRNAKSVVIDCTQEQLFRCRVAAHMLKEAGITEVVLQH